MNNMFTFEDKAKYISQCYDKTDLNQTDWQIISELSKDESTDIRLDVGEMLSSFPCQMSENILLSMINDSEYLVRTTVIDSLSFSKSETVLNVLRDSLKDNRFLVRGYAALSLGDVQNNIGTDFDETIEILKRSFKRERGEWCKIAIAGSLFLLGEDSFLEVLINNINNRFYKNRLFALNSIIDIFEKCSDRFDKKKLLDILYKRKQTEKTLSVNKALDKLTDIVKMS